ncbi:MAG: TonB-dependent receptor [Dysgonamonadaceae bacterium]|jgi:outer membrane receptor for ferrienterochelin and colicin|nr:TonB-dependent receptor [Dysgonamonadaceae bacterium]
MNRKITGIIALFGVAVSLYAQNYTVSGYVRDAETGETLAGSNVYEAESGKGCFSNTYGFYTLTLPKGKGTVHWSFLGYESRTVNINPAKDTTIHIYLKPVSAELPEIIVGSAAKLKDLRLGTVEIPLPQIKNTPALLGETDLMKALQFIPGVRNTTEGKSDLSVRGGSPDQNLTLLDGVPIYNPNHVFGFLSVFNTDALKKVTLYKSSFPARFGGRLSSVVDITTKDGNKKRFSGSVSLGLPTFKLNMEGPIVKDRTSFTFSARRTYMDLLVDAANKWFIRDNSGSRANFSFYDLNAKIHHKIDDKTHVYLSAYSGNDKLNQETAGIEDNETAHNASSEKWDWGNTIVSGKLSRVFTPNLFFKGAITYNHYNFRINTDDRYENANDSTGVQQASRSFLFSSGIKDYSVSDDFEYSPASNHAVKFGTAFTFHDFNPEVISLTSKSDTLIVNDNVPQHVFSRESAFYAEDDWDISQKIRFNAGLRFSLFNVDNETYAAIDPRLSLRYLLTDKLALQAGYSLMQQYVHLLSSNSVILQTDLWVPVTGKIKPMQSSQYSAGVFYEPSKSVFLSLETYYKDMRNVIEYKDGISYTSVSAGWENKVEAGTGRACGLEFSAEKREGRITGTASYTLSKSERRFDNINFGEWFPAKYDRRHALNLLLNYKLNNKFDFTAAWTYHSGDRITLPVMTYVHPYVPDTNGFPYEPQWDGGGFNLLELDYRNNYRMADYHRLDLGMNYTFAKKKNRYSVLNLSVYNAYNRMNPYKIIMESDLDENKDYIHKLKQITLFPIIPSLSYTYHF